VGISNFIINNYSSIYKFNSLFVLFIVSLQIVTVYPRSTDARKYTSASNYIERIMYMAKEKVRTIRSSFPDRPLYVVGWGSGSILAARLSNTMGPFDGIIALGFPLLSLKRMHEDLHKVFCGLKHPILFVIGGLASNNRYGTKYIYSGIRFAISD